LTSIGLWVIWMVTASSGNYSLVFPTTVNFPTRQACEAEIHVIVDERRADPDAARMLCMNLSPEMRR
jgi:hypothetical protein